MVLDTGHECPPDVHGLRRTSENSIIGVNKKEIHDMMPCSDKKRIISFVERSKKNFQKLGIISWTRTKMYEVTNL